MNSMNVTQYPGPEYDSCYYFVNCGNRKNALQFKKSLIAHLSDIYKITHINIIDVGVSGDHKIWFLYMSDFDLPQEGWDKIEEIWKDSMS